MFGLFSGFSGREPSATPRAASAKSGKRTLARALPASGEHPLPPALLELVERLDQNVFVLDDRSRFAGVTRPFRNLVGLPAERLVGLPATEVLNTGRRDISECVTGAVDVRDAAGTIHRGTLSVVALPGELERYRIGVLTTNRQADGPRGAASVRARIHTTEAMEAFGNAVNEKLRETSPPHRLIAGRIELVTLDEIRRALGDRWPAHAEAARAAAKSVLRGRLAKEDLVAEVEDGKFLVCFARGELSETRTKSRLLAREIRERLLGESRAAFSVAFDVESVEVGAETAHGEPSGVLSTLMQNLDTARSQQQQRLLSNFTKLTANATLTLRPVVTRKLSASGLFMAELNGECAEYLEQINPGEQREHVSFELDTLLLGLTLKKIYSGLKHVGRQGVIVPVHYNTVNEKRFSEKYFDLCRQADDAARARIVAELHDIPPGVPDARLQDLLSCLSPFCSHRVVRAPGTARRFVDLNRFRLAMISIVTSRHERSDARLARELGAFAKMVHQGGTYPAMCHNGGCRVLVHDVPDKASVPWYAARGGDFFTIRPARRRGADDGWEEG